MMSITSLTSLQQRFEKHDATIDLYRSVQR